MDHEDTGEKGFNYRSERFFNRLKRIPIISKVFSSKTHGDPATPILESYTGERVIIRYLIPADKPRNISFVLHGHNWLAQPDDPFSRRISVQGAVSVGGVYNIELENGASEYPGDYLYRSGSLKWDVESGMWGIFRVMKKGINAIAANMLVIPSAIGGKENGLKNKIDENQWIPAITAGILDYEPNELCLWRKLCILKIMFQNLWSFICFLDAL